MDTIFEGLKGRALHGNITVPGDKSITHRAIILAAIAQGESKIYHFLDGLDCNNTIMCMEHLGVRIEKVNNSFLKIAGKGLYGLRKPKKILDVGNSGTTIRLLSGLLSGQNFNTTIDGDNSIRKRPMKRIIQPLSFMNAKIHGKYHPYLAPLNITGSSLKGIEYTLQVASAQVKSAILLAGLYARGITIIKEPEITRDHTERMLSLMKADIQYSMNHQITIKPGRNLVGTEIDIPGDISSAAYFLAAVCAQKESEIVVQNVGINPTRVGFIEVLKEMGASLEIKNQKEIFNEPRANIKIKGESLKAIQISKKMIASVIDELPLVAVIATQALGKTVVKDAQELRVKEADRIKAIVDGLSRMGANIIEREDGFEIFGPTPLKGSIVNSYNDHRIAMSLAVASIYAEGKTVVQDSEYINISYPGFMKTYYGLINEY